MKNLLAIAVTLLFSVSPVLAGPWKVVDDGYTPVYYVVNGVLFVVNFPVAAGMWVNKHIRTHIHKAAEEEAKAEAKK